MPKCLLCQLKKPHLSGICSKCLKDLPWNMNFCNQCALPINPAPLEASQAESGDAPHGNAALTKGGINTCWQCLSAPPKFSVIRTSFCYQFPINRLINDFKNQQNIAMGKNLGKMLAHSLKAEPSLQDSPPELLLPVPSHQDSMIKRGYNPSEIIADELSRSLSIPTSTDSVIKPTQSKQQKALTASERFTNLSNAFSLTPKGVSSLAGYYRVAIIDDIVTTGATANALSETLLNAGVQDVVVWAIARTP